MSVNLFGHEPIYTVFDRWCGDTPAGVTVSCPCDERYMEHVGSLPAAREGWDRHLGSILARRRAAFVASASRENVKMIDDEMAVL